MGQDFILQAGFRTGFCQTLANRDKAGCKPASGLETRPTSGHAAHVCYTVYMARRRFFVPEVRAGRAQIEGDDAHHLTRVLRVEAGQKYELSDNRNVYLAEVETAHKNLVSFTVIGQVAAQEPVFDVDVYASLVRFERFELLIEKATELGCRRIVPVQAGRSEKGLDRAAVKRLERWRRIAREASEQSRRIRLPEILEPLSFEQALGVEAQHRYALDEDPAAQPFLKALPHSVHDAVALLAGPEGGWTDRERSAIQARQWHCVSLGPTILKTETAVLAALAILNASHALP